MSRRNREEIPFGSGGPLGRLRRLRRYAHNGIVQGQNLRLIEVDGLGVLADITGAVNPTWKFFELFGLDRSQSPHRNFRRLGDLL